jgi:hypothetical protein
LRLPHPLYHLLTGEAPIEVVAVRQKTAFSRNLFDVAGKDLVVQKSRDDLLGSQAFRDGDLVLHHFALSDCLDDIAQAGVLGEHVLAGLEVRSCIERDHAGEKRQPVLINDALMRKQIGNVHDPRARRDHDDLGFLQGSRGFQPTLAQQDCPSPYD